MGDKGGQFVFDAKLGITQNSLKINSYRINPVSGRVFSLFEISQKITTLWYMRLLGN